MTRLVSLRPHRQAPWSDLNGRVEPMSVGGRWLTFLLLCAALGLPLWLILSDAFREARTRAQFERDLQQVKAGQREAERLLADLARVRGEVPAPRAEVRR